MTPEQRLLAKWLGVLLFLVAVFFSGFGVRSYMANAEATATALEHAQAMNDALADHAEQLKAVTDRNLELQGEINTLNATHTKVLNENLAENARLRTDLAVAKRMRLQGTSCPRPAAGADDPGTGSVGDGAGVELSEETRLLVWDLREDLIRDRGKLDYLQAWARRVMATNPELEPPPKR